MRAQSDQPRTQEIELKLALPHADLDSVVALLKKSAPLARRRAAKHLLCNVYYDTPDFVLRQRRIALRVRQVMNGGTSHWIQTLKTAGSADSALSLRGEWEQQVPDQELNQGALAETPWGEIDPEGTVFEALAPCFTTDFERTIWQVRTKDHSEIEVALDIGKVHCGPLSAPICELELELKSGHPKALFDVAHAIARTVAVLPANRSKAERGYALHAGTLERPQRAKPPGLQAELSVAEAAQQVLRESLFQLTQNLDILRGSDNAEVVHQARIGWRRFKSALRLFKPALAQGGIPDLGALKPLLVPLGTLRDLDVAVTETLPLIAASYATVAGDHQSHWDHLINALASSAKLQRATVRETLQKPSVGAALLHVVQYIEQLTSLEKLTSKPAACTLQPWAEHRLQKLSQRLEVALSGAVDTESQHRARILAKRLRYSLESMHGNLPKKSAKRWLKRATKVQGSIGFGRDIQRAHLLAQKVNTDPALVEFLRGFSAGLSYQIEPQPL